MPRSENPYEDYRYFYREGFKAAVRVRVAHVHANRGLERVWGKEYYNAFGCPIGSSFLVSGEGWFALMPLAIDEPMQQILEFSTLTVAERFDLLRKNPEALEEEIARNEQLIMDILDPEAAYLKQDDGVVVKDAA